MADQQQPIPALVDNLVTHTLGLALDAQPAEAEAIVSGALMAVVRFYTLTTAKEGQPFITRDVLTGLTPALHKTAESVMAERKALVEAKNKGLI